MRLSEQLASRLREVWLDGKWVAGTNFKEQISQLNWEQAISEFNSLNSIAAITFHINYYTAGLIKVLEGGPLEIKDTFSFDAPTIESAADWTKLVDSFCNDSEKFVLLVKKMSDEALAKSFVVEKYGSYYRNIDAMIEHSYYHLGQIILIRKLLDV